MKGSTHAPPRTSRRPRRRPRSTPRRARQAGAAFARRPRGCWHVAHDGHHLAVTERLDGQLDLRAVGGRRITISAGSVRSPCVYDRLSACVTAPSTFVVVSRRWISKPTAMSVVSPATTCAPASRPAQPARAMASRAIHARAAGRTIIGRAAARRPPATPREQARRRGERGERCAGESVVRGAVAAQAGGRFAVDAARTDGDARRGLHVMPCAPAPSRTSRSAIPR